MNKYEVIDFNAYDLCVISDNRLVVTNLTNATISLYNENFTLLKTTSRLNGKSFQPYSITSNLTEDKIYICDHINNSITMVDSNLNYLASYGGKCGQQHDHFNCPLGIEYYNNYLYCCDSRNRRIQKLTSCLSYSSSIQLEYLPWQIKIANNLACIRDLFEQEIYFHDIHTFEIKFNYSGHNGFISLIGTFFYEYYYQTNTIYCYDEDGMLYDEIKFDKLNDLHFYSWSSMLLYNEKFIMTAEPSKKLIIV